ncbi:cytochrome P450-dit2 [Allomyces arbusculus]|nr:cytochrome P450-dit2 [Allomyces arbusculus]
MSSTAFSATHRALAAKNALVRLVPDTLWSWIARAAAPTVFAAVLYVAARVYRKIIRVPPALRHLPRVTAWQSLSALTQSTDIVTALRKQLTFVVQDAHRRSLPLADKDSVVPPAWASWVFGEWAVIVANPDDVRAVLTQLDAFDKPIFTPIPSLLGKTNIVFSPARILFMLFGNGDGNDLFGDLGRQLLVHLDDAGARGTPVLVNYWMRRLTLDAIALAAFGQSFHGLTDQESAIVDDFEAMMEGALNPLINALGPTLLRWTPMYARLERRVDKFNTFILDLVDRKLAALKARKEAGLVASEQDMDLLDMMVEAADGDSEYMREDLRSDTVIFFVAGHDTTSNALTAAIYFLGRYPAVQERARAEVLSVLDDVHPTCPVDVFPYLTNDQATRVPFLTAIIKETLRLYPSIAIIPPRVTTTTVTLRDGTSLPPGTRVVASTMALHRSPALWGDDADEFRPERFLEVDADKMHAGAHGFKWVPFGAGQRVCLGQSFSIMEQRVVLAMLLARYEWTIVGDTEAMKGTPRTTRGGLMQMMGIEAVFKRRA